MRILASFLTLLFLAVNAHSITVTTLIDENDPIGAGGAVSLREAIRDVASGGTVDFDPGLSGGTIELLFGELVFGNGLTIDASSLAGGISIDAARSGGVIRFVTGFASSHENVTLRNLGIRNGLIAGSNGAGISASAVVGTTLDLVIEDCHIEGCETDRQGAAIASEEGIHMIVNRSSFIGNRTTSTGSGTAVALYGGHADFTNCTFACNHAQHAVGSAIYIVNGASATFAHCTVTQNHAKGGAIFVESGTLQFHHTIIAANSGENIATEAGGTASSFGYNIIGDVFPVPSYAKVTDILDNDPQLLEPMRRGGITYTCAFRPTSPACDAGDPLLFNPPATDQRGFARERDGNGSFFGGAEIDIGAFELGETITVDIQADENGAPGTGNGTSMREAISEAATNGAGTRIAIDPSLSDEFISLDHGELLISTPLWLDGRQTEINAILYGSPFSRILRIAAGVCATVEAVNLRAGTSTEGGAARLDPGACANFVDCQLTQNRASNSGGAIYVDGATIFLLRCTVGANYAGTWGGGISFRGSLEAVNCLFVNNEAVSGGGAISDTGSDQLSIEHCSFLNNTADNRGGGIDLAITEARITYSAFLDNTPSNHFGGSIVSGGYNAESSTGMFSQPTDKNSVTDLFEVEAPYEDIRTRTAYHKTHRSSDLIDAGQTVEEYSGCLHIDHRGLSRTRDGDGDGIARIDIGSTESDTVFIVDTHLDENDGLGVGTGASLREAILSSNTDLDHDIIEFSPGLCNQPIQLQAASGGELYVSGRVSITGLGNVPGGKRYAPNTVEILGSGSGPSQFRIFRIASTGRVKIEGLTLSGGNAGAANGGGILAESGSDLTISYCTVRHCLGQNGGGIAAEGTKLLQSNSTLAYNTAASDGGGLWAPNLKAQSFISTSTLAGNRAANGGGLVVSDNCPISSNTIAYNTASTQAGGLLLTPSSMSFGCFDTLIAHNSPDDAVVTPSYDAPMSMTTDSNASFINIPNADLSPLGDYGGSTLTVRPNAGSPVIGVVGGGNFPDQRLVTSGLPLSNVGSFQLGESIVVDTAVDENDGIATGGISLRDAIASATTPGTRISFAPALQHTTLELISNLVIDTGKLIHIDGTGVEGITISSATPRQIVVAGYAEFRGLRFTGPVEILVSPFGTDPSSHARVDRCHFQSAGSIGAAVWGTHCSTIEIVDSTFQDIAVNSAPVLIAGRGTVRGCTFVNSAGFESGGISLKGAKARAKVDFCTFVRGSRSGSGGGAAIRIETGAVAEIGQCAFDHAAGTDPVGAEVGGATISLGNNFSRNFALLLGHATDATGDPMLGALDTTGELPVLVPMPGSPLIDQFSPLLKDAPRLDVRGNRRMIDGDVNGSELSDVGAIEALPTIFVDTEIDENDGLAAGGISLRDAINFLNTRNYAETPAIRFAPHLDGATVRIVHVHGELVLTAEQDIDASSLPGGITIAGPRFDGGAQFRVMQANAPGETVRLGCLTLAEGIANDFGGGLLVENGTACVLTDCTVRDSGAPMLGGGIAARGGSGVFLERCTISGNLCGGFGGGLGVDGSFVEVLNSTISGNHADTGGGGIADLNSQCDVGLQHVTIAANTASNGGGGIDFAFQSGRASHVILAQNSPVNFHDRTANGNVASIGYNLDDGTNTQFTSGADLAGVPDAKLGPLQNNGGRTETHALLFGSPAIDNGDPGIAGFPAFDQTGFRARVQDGDYLNPATIDIGAFELDLSTLPIDMDGDCVPNADEVAMGWDPTNPADGLADTDGDGRSNGKEWIAGTDPNDPLSLLELLAVQNISNNNSQFQLTWRSVIDPAISYSIYYSEDLKEWFPVRTGIPANSTETVSFATTPPGKLRLFFEIRAVRP